MNRREARELAFKLLFQIDINEDGLEYIEEKDDYLTTILTGVNKHLQEIDNIIRDHLINWTIERIARVDKTILRLAIYELNYMEDIPTNVSINEAVELAHKYGDEKSSKFVNGILSNIMN